VDRSLGIKKLLIKKHGLLGGLGEEAQEILAESAQVLVLEAQDFVFHQGEQKASFYALCLGKIKVFRLSPEGKEAFVKLLQPGEIFGEASIFKDQVFPASAQCTEAVTLLEISRQSLVNLLKDESFRLDFMAALFEKLQYLSRRVYFLEVLDLEDRFFSYIVDHYGLSGTYDLDISKKDLASALGTVPETLSRLLFKLKNRSYISWEDRLLRFSPQILEELRAKEDYKAEI